MADEQTIIADGVRLTGDLTGDGDVHVAGRFEGSIQVRGTVTIAQAAMVIADIIAGSVRIDGVLEGKVRAIEAVTIGPKGLLVGDVKAHLSIEEGGIFQGRVDLDAAVPKPGRRPVREATQPAAAVPVPPAPAVRSFRPPTAAPAPPPPPGAEPGPALHSPLEVHSEWDHFDQGDFEDPPAGSADDGEDPDPSMAPEDLPEPASLRSARPSARRRVPLAPTARSSGRMALVGLPPDGTGEYPALSEPGADEADATDTGVGEGLRVRGPTRTRAQQEPSGATDPTDGESSPTDPASLVGGRRRAVPAPPEASAPGLVARRRPRAYTNPSAQREGVGLITGIDMGAVLSDEPPSVTADFDDD